MRLGIHRRDPISRERYRAFARSAGRPRIRPRSRRFDAALALAVVLAVLVAFPLVGSAAGAGLQQLTASLGSAFPLFQGRGSIELPVGAAAVAGGSPIVDVLPAFTRDPQLQFAGRIPTFAVQPGRKLQIVLNGVVVATDQVAQTGLFSAALTLKDGANVIGVSLLADRDVVASSSYTVVLDRTPPALTIVRPQAGSVVDAQSVVVEGKTEVGATVTVNGRTVAPTAEGLFADSFTATPGPLVITVVSRDRAGNEATERVSIVTSESVTSATTLTVSLDRSSARPGQPTLATIVLRDASGPRAGVQVTLSVGVVLVGQGVTDRNGAALIAFAAPTTEGDIGVVALGGGVSGRATLTVSSR